MPGRRYRNPYRFCGAPGEGARCDRPRAGWAGPGRVGAGPAARVALSSLRRRRAWRSPNCGLGGAGLVVTESALFLHVAWLDLRNSRRGDGGAHICGSMRPTDVRSSMRRGDLRGIRNAADADSATGDAGGECDRLRNHSLPSPKPPFVGRHARRPRSELSAKRAHTERRAHADCAGRARRAERAPLSAAPQQPATPAATVQASRPHAGHRRHPRP